MRKTTAGWMVALALLGVATACDEGVTDLEVDPSRALAASGPAEVTLPVGEEVPVEGTPLRLVFTRVVEDSRCAVDVQCVWAGNALVEVGVGVDAGSAFPLQLNSNLDPRSARWRGVRITYRELLPRPRSDAPTDPADYTLRVRVEAEGS